MPMAYNTAVDPTKMADFESAEGNMDWDAYSKARVTNGDDCRICGRFILWPQGSPALCDSCEMLANEVGEVEHDCYVRCPHCGETRDLRYGTNYELFGEGKHDVMCMHEDCEKTFTISTRVSYEFTSPARIAEPVIAE